MMLPTFFVYFSSTFLFFYPNAVVSQPGERSSDLSLLILLPEGDANAEDCRIASQIAIDSANFRQQDVFSQGVRLQPEFRLMGSYPAMRAVIEYARNCSSPTNAKNCSSIIVGPSGGSDCESVGSTLHLFGLMAITPGCRGLTFTQNRARYPNLFRTQIPLELQIFAKLKFIAEVGNWSRLVVVTSQPTSEAYLVSKRLQDEAKLLGIETALFLAVGDVTQVTLQEIKTSPFRIIVVDVVETKQQALAFLCMAQAMAMTPGEGYVYIFRWDTFSNPSAASTSMPMGCERRKVLEMYSTSFWIGDAILSSWFLRSSNKTLLGYNLTEFRQEFFARKPQESSYSGVVACHDAVLQTIGTLRTARQSSDQLTWGGETWISVLKSAAQRVEYVPLANAGQLLRYTNRSEMDLQTQFVYQFDSSTGSIDAIFQVQLQQNLPETLLNSYQLTANPNRPIVWPDRLVPSDAKLVLGQMDNVPLPALIILTVIAVVLIVGQLYSLIACNVLRDWPPMMQTLPRCKAALLEGLIYMNVAAILLLINGVSRLDLLCRFRWFFVMASCARVHGVIVPKTVCYYVRIRNRENFSRFNQSETVQKNERFVLIGSAIFTTSCIVAFLLWMMLDPIQGEVLPIGLPQRLQASTYRQVWTEVCRSDWQPFWIALFCLLNFALLAVGSLFGFLTRNVVYEPEFGFADVKFWRYAIWASLLNLVITIVVVALLRGQTTAQMLATSIGLLIQSTSIDSFLFFPNGKLYFRQLLAVLSGQQRPRFNELTNAETVAMNPIVAPQSLPQAEAEAEAGQAEQTLPEIRITEQPSQQVSEDPKN